MLSACVELGYDDSFKYDKDEREKMSTKYLELANLVERGSKKHIMLLNKSVRLNPDNDMAWRALSQPYLYAGEYDKWSDCLEKAIALKPEVWQGWRAYDKVYYLKDYSGALFDLVVKDTLQNLNEDYVHNTSTTFMRGLCYLGMKDYINAETYFKLYISKESESVGDAFVDETVFLYLGILALEQDEYHEAIGYLLRGVQYEEGVADFDFHRARAHECLGERQKAVEALGIAKNKLSEGNKLRSYRSEALYEIYMSDIESLSEDMGVLISIDS